MAWPRPHDLLDTRTALLRLIALQGYYCTRGSPISAPGSLPVTEAPWVTALGFYGAICPAGGYCPSGSYTPQPCPVGTYLNTTGEGCRPRTAFPVQRTPAPLNSLRDLLRRRVVPCGLPHVYRRALLRVSQERATHLPRCDHLCLLFVQLHG